MNALIRDEWLGAMVAVLIMTLCILVFVSRLAGRPAAEHRLGIALLLTALPLFYLLFRAPRFQRPPLFYVQIGLMLLYLAVEFVLDYWLRIDFRTTRWAVISYVTLFFAGTGGMIGVASLAGRGWSITSVSLFLLMAVLAFVQRRITGM